jgi:hypothetical protein
MDATVSTPVYRPLTRTHDLRLLHIEPGRFSDRIQCKLHHANLNDKPTYVALSYVWGNSAIIAPVLCNGTEVSVTVSLVNALRRLRQSVAPVAVWVDALCINQADTAERSRQVGIMAEIYKSANQVVVYLGEDTEDTATAFSLIRRLCLFLDSEQDPERRQRAFNLGYLEGKGSDIPPARDPGWTALRNLYQRDYFSRIWVVQEVALSPYEPRVVCGSHQTRWREIMQVANFCLAPNYVLSNGAIKTYAPAAAYMGQVRDALITGENTWSLNLQHLLSCTRHAHATDPRDKLFALYGLANDISGPDGPLLQADYSMSLRDVLLLAMKFLVLRRRSFMTLAYAGLHPGRTGNLPSWVTDWGRPGPGPFDPGLGALGYNASGGVPSLATLAANGKSLQVLGKPVDRVQSFFPLSKAYITVIPEFRQPGRLRTLWADTIALLGTDYVLGGTVVDAFWRTLIANQGPTNQPAQDEYYHHFLAFWRNSRLADAAAEALGRTAISPVPDDADIAKQYIAAMERVRNASFSNPDQRAAWKRYYSRVLRENGRPCICGEATDTLHNIPCEHCALVGDPRFFERAGFGPLREDDPSLTMMDDPFVAAWFRGLRTDQNEPHPMTKAEGQYYGTTLGRMVTGRSFIVTEKGLMGLAPVTTQLGDVVVVTAGANVPFILRPRVEENGGPEKFVFVGEAYVHGVMGGEAVLWDGEGRSVWQKMELE